MATQSTAVPKEPPVTKTVFDLNSFEEVLLAKEVPFSPVASVDEAVSKLGNDAKALLEIINIGLRTKLRNDASSDSNIPWMETDENGKITDKEFTGVVADSKSVNALRLNLAKTFSAGKWDSLDADAKRTFKDQALNFIKSSAEIKTSLQAGAANAEE